MADFDFDLNAILLQIQQKLGDPALQTMFANIIRSAIGTSPQGIDALDARPGHTLSYNLYWQQESNYRNALTKGINNSLMDTAMNTSLASMYRLAGYDQAAAMAQASQSNDIVKALWGQVTGRQFAPQINRFTSAAYGRRGAWDPMNAYEYFKGTNGVGDVAASLMDSAIAGKVGGLGIGDTFDLAASMVRTGKYDGNLSALEQDALQYARELNKLKDVLQGSISEIMTQMEGLIGGSVLNMSSGRAGTVSANLRNTLMFSGMSAGQLSQLSASQYGLIAPMGGTTYQATGMAMFNAQMIGQGISVEDLTVQGFNDSLTRYNAAAMASGRSRDFAAAYVHWANANGQPMEATEQSLNAFTSAVGNPSAYLQQNNVSSYLRASKTVDKMSADPRLLARLGQEDYNAYVNSFGRIQSEILSASGIRITDDMLLWDDQTFMSQGWDVDVAARVSRMVGNARRSATGMSDDESALQFLRNAQGTHKMTAVALLSDAWSAIIGSQGDNVLQGGMTGIFNALSQTGRINDLGDLLKAAFGINVPGGELSAANLEAAMKVKGVDEHNFAALMSAPGWMQSVALGEYLGRPGGAGGRAKLLAWMGGASADEGLSSYVSDLAISTEQKNILRDMIDSGSGWAAYSKMSMEEATAASASWQRALKMVSGYTEDASDDIEQARLLREYQIKYAAAGTDEKRTELEEKFRGGYGAFSADWADAFVSDMKKGTKDEDILSSIFGVLQNLPNTIKDLTASLSALGTGVANGGTP